MKVRHNVVIVRASPRLGGDVEVGFSCLKQFHGPINSDTDSNSDNDSATHSDSHPQCIVAGPIASDGSFSNQTPALTVPSAGPVFTEGPSWKDRLRSQAATTGVGLGGSSSVSQAHSLKGRGDELETYNQAEHQRQRFFFVETILKHKYKQNYQFLTKWYNYPIEDATWEPIQSFIQPNGFINEVLKTYCTQHKLDKAYKSALQLSQQLQH